MSERFKRLELPGEDRPEEAAPGATVFDAAYYLAEGGSRYWRGDFEGALREYSRALREDPHLAEGWVGQLRCLIELEEFPEAVLWGAKAEEQLGAASEVRALRAVALHALDRDEEALGLLDVALKAPRTAPAVWIARGEVVLAANARNARFCFLKAQEGPENPAVQAWIGRAYERAGYHQKALEHYRKSLALDDGRPWVWLRAGACYARLGIPERAEHALGQALKLRPGYAAAESALVQLARQNPLGRWWRRLAALAHGRH